MLRQQGVENTYIEIIRNIYNISVSRIRLESKGDLFPTNRAVRQRDPLSSKLFTAVLENIFRSLDGEEYGLDINSSRLNHLRFADDLILIEEDSNKLQAIAQKLAIRSKGEGREINKSKTKVMYHSIEIEIKLDGNSLDYVSKYVYFGQIIAPNDQMSKEINKRITSGYKKYWSLKEIMKSNELNVSMKKKTFNICVLPCITYECETWSLIHMSPWTHNHREKLARCQRAMERCMIGIELTGHMLRCTTNKWSKQVTLWYPRDGEKKQGHPFRTWADDAPLTLGSYWTRVEADILQWKNSLKSIFKVAARSQSSVCVQTRDNFHSAANRADRPPRSFASRRAVPAAAEISAHPLRAGRPGSA
ncbi:Putative uncharacterized transposon-derived protein F52C9.6 [Eumeta japonica]|uniref:Uncharacterized transposon-derived protein F52C9.6 n=1 Tax=Eumeta variegata TaxID=151549 RepID=A0A4C1UW45_EUMVA|nr:Putative uncharacterized transposon-derived protein F52C9.6 [Eumeta japonica]